MKSTRVILFAVAVACMTASLAASVREVQIYGIVERVVLEPNDRAPERIKVWGAFALLYTNQEPVLDFCCGDVPYTPHRGFLYFKLPPVTAKDRTAQEAAKKEWADLKAMAGTGQAITFGSWTSAFLGLPANSRKDQGFVSLPPYKESLHVYPENERSPSPITYTMDTGIVKLQSQGKFAALIAQLQKSLQR